MKRSKHAPLWKQGLAAALALVLLLAAGCGADAGKAATDSAAATGGSDASTAAVQSTEPVRNTEASVETEPATEETVPYTKSVLGLISLEEERLNRFLTGFVQQEIVNTQTELDEDAELVRFVFRYLQTNDPGSVLEQEDGDEPCRILTLEQVNETLTKLMGRTITPDREDYSIIADGEEEFHCSFRDGRFIHTPPYFSFAYGFPLRFALVERIDREACTLYFRLYRVNPLLWEVGEADRHVPLLPSMSFLDADRGPEIAKIGTGVAVLRDLGEDLQLVEYEIDLHP